MAGGAASTIVSIVNPWEDASVGFVIVDDADPIIDALNNLYFPERFTAMWHLDTKRLEIIFTADPLPPVWSDLSSRQFDFVHKEATYKCLFGKASPRLTELATRAIAQQPSRTSYRNLMSFQRHYFAEAKPGDLQLQPDAVPYCFWVDGIEWNDDLVIDLAHHLNFYMAYFDNLSPAIIIHTPEREAAASSQITRFPFDSFPSSIIANPLDENLLQFWIASREGDPVRRFIYAYQILEYAGTYYIKDNIRRAIRRAVSAPDVFANVERVTQQVIEAIEESKMQDPQRTEAIIRQTANPALLWAEIEKNIAYFSLTTS